jgi:hypothetical protein
VEFPPWNQEGSGAIEDTRKGEKERERERK